MPRPFRRRPELTRIHRTEMNGVPCFWADAPPPFTAAVVFRVGRADETLATAGITHLAEHVLMPASPPRDFERNARVEDIYAVFWAEGTRERSLRFVEDLAALIADPPLHRVDTERSILRTEAAGGSWHPVPMSMALRYGAQGHGLVGHEEYGVTGCTADDVAAWIARFFTRENAAVWLTGDPGRDLLGALPSGERRPTPAPEVLEEVDLPAAYPTGPDNTVIVSFDAHRSPALALATSVLERRAWQTIRYDRGLAYDIGEVFEAVGPDLVHETIWIESLPENVDAVRDALLALLESLAEDGATAEELREEVELLRETHADPAQVRGVLHFGVSEHLLGRETTPEEFLRSREEVTPEATAEAVQHILQRLLVVVPTAEQMPASLNEYPMTSSHAVEGVEYRPSGLRLSRDARRTSLTVGAGATWRIPNGSLFTITADDVRVCLRWADGSRTLWGRDGTNFTIDPADWRNGKEVIARIDSFVQPDRIVSMDPERARVVDAIEDVASRKLKRRWVIGDELESLPDALEPDETLLTLAEANRGLRAGLLVATDQRLLWLYTFWKPQRLDMPYSEIRSVRTVTRLFERKLEIRHLDELVTFTDIAPKPRAAELETIVGERIAALGAREDA